MKKRLRIYLDTNIIYGYFKTAGKSVLEGKDYRKTKTLIFLEQNLELIEPFTSFFTLMEVAENLRDELGLDVIEIEKLIHLSRKILKVKILESLTLSGDSLKWFLSGVEFKDAIQANIAKNLQLTFISNDKNLIRKIKKFYANATSFKGLQRMIEKLRLNLSLS